jgi:hypothetical protein
MPFVLGVSFGGEDVGEGTAHDRATVVIDANFDAPVATTGEDLATGH